MHCLTDHTFSATTRNVEKWKHVKTTNIKHQHKTSQVTPIIYTFISCQQQVNHDDNIIWMFHKTRKKNNNRFITIRTWSNACRKLCEWQQNICPVNTRNKQPYIVQESISVYTQSRLLLTLHVICIYKRIKRMEHVRCAHAISY